MWRSFLSRGWHTRKVQPSHKRMQQASPFPGPSSRANATAFLTPHPGPLPVEGRGSRDGGARIVGQNWPRAHDAGERRFRSACNPCFADAMPRRTTRVRRAPSPLNGERAGVRGEKTNGALLSWTSLKRRGGSGAVERSPGTPAQRSQGERSRGIARPSQHLSTHSQT